MNALLKTITLEEIKNETEKDMDLVTLREGIKNNSYQKLNMDKYEIFGTELTIIIYYYLFFEARGIKHKDITPLWPTANGLTKRFMQTINKCIRTSITRKTN